LILGHQEYITQHINKELDYSERAVQPIRID